MKTTARLLSAQIDMILKTLRSINAYECRTEATDCECTVHFTVPAYGRSVRMSVPKPMVPTLTPRGKKRRESAIEQDRLKASAQAWGLLAQLLEAKVTAVVVGGVSFDEEFLPYILLGDNQVLRDWIPERFAGMYENKDIPATLVRTRMMFDSIKNVQEQNQIWQRWTSQNAEKVGEMMRTLDQQSKDVIQAYPVEFQKLQTDYRATKDRLDRTSDRLSYTHEAFAELRPALKLLRRTKAVLLATRSDRNPKFLPNFRLEEVWSGGEPVHHPFPDKVRLLFQHVAYEDMTRLRVQRRYLESILRDEEARHRKEGSSNR